MPLKKVGGSGSEQRVDLMAFLNGLLENILEHSNKRDRQHAKIHSMLRVNYINNNIKAVPALKQSSS